MALAAVRLVYGISMSVLPVKVALSDVSCPRAPFSYFTCACLRSGEGKCVRQSQNLTGRRLEKTFVDQLFVSEQIKITKSENF